MCSEAGLEAWLRVGVGVGGSDLGGVTGLRWCNRTGRRRLEAQLQVWHTVVGTGVGVLRRSCGWVGAAWLGGSARGFRRGMCVEDSEAGSHCTTPHSLPTRSPPPICRTCPSPCMRPRRSWRCWGQRATYTHCTHHSMSLGFAQMPHTHVQSPCRRPRSSWRCWRRGEMWRAVGWWCSAWSMQSRCAQCDVVCVHACGAVDGRVPCSVACRKPQQRPAASSTQTAT